MKNILNYYLLKSYVQEVGLEDGTGSNIFTIGKRSMQRAKEISIYMGKWRVPSSP